MYLSFGISISDLSLCVSATHAAAAVIDFFVCTSGFIYNFVSY